MAEGAALMCWMEVQGTHVEAAQVHSLKETRGVTADHPAGLSSSAEVTKEWQCHHLQELKTAVTLPPSELGVTNSAQLSVPQLSMCSHPALCSQPLVLPPGVSSSSRMSWWLFPHLLTHLVPDLSVHKILLHLESFKGSFLHLNLRDSQNPAQ